MDGIVSWQQNLYSYRVYGKQLVWIEIRGFGVSLGFQRGFGVSLGFQTQSLEHLDLPTTLFTDYPNFLFNPLLGMIQGVGYTTFAGILSPI